MQEREEQEKAMAMETRIAQGSASFRRIDLQPVRVVLVLQNLRLEGTIHMEPGISRFSDAWDSLLRERRKFFPVTDVKMVSHEGKTIGSVKFMAVEKDEVGAVYPVE